MHQSRTSVVTDDPQLRFLTKNLSIYENSFFKGRVLVFSGNKAFDRQTFEFSHLLPLGIPVISTLSHSESAQSKILMSQLFQEDNRPRLRGVLWVDKLPKSFIRLLGVRFILSNMRLSESWLIDLKTAGHYKYLYGVLDSNVNGLAVPKSLAQLPLNIAWNELNKLYESRQNNVSGKPVKNKLSPRLQIRVTKNAFHIIGYSNNAESWVLPIEFSNCIKPSGTHNNDLEISRVLGIFTEISFNGSLDIVLDRHLPSIGISRCTFHDAAWLHANYSSLEQTMVHQSS